MPVRHVLLDADGVVQHGVARLGTALSEHIGAEAATGFLETTFADGAPVLRGEVELAVLMGEVLGEGIDAEQVYVEACLAIETDPDSIALIGALRSAGYQVHLGTNQDPARARHMRTVLGYDDLFDVSCYSCDLGVAKPDPAYFLRAAELIGAPAEEILFVDDTEPNVLAARGVGLGAVHWSIADGHDRLRGLLGEVGVYLG